MKKYLLLAMLLLVNNSLYAKLGRHNLQVNVGGGFSSLIMLPTMGSATQFSKGGGLTVELGYLLHSVRESGIIHGFDLRADFTMGFLSGKQELLLLTGSWPFFAIVTGNQTTQNMYGGFAMTYTVGRQLTSGRLMFDVIGFGITYGVADYTLTYKSATPLSSTASGIAAQFVFPGVQYIMNNGFTFGWRNKFKINGGKLGRLGKFGFDTMVTLGYTFGGGKQPWEN